MVNHLGIALGDTPEEILSNLDQGRFDPEAVALDGALASDPEYIERVREVDASTPRDSIQTLGACTRPVAVREARCVCGAGRYLRQAQSRAGFLCWHQ